MATGAPLLISETRSRPSTLAHHRNPSTLRNPILGTRACAYHGHLEPIPGLELPFDILLAIMEVSPRRTIARMMRTCRAVRNDGARILLGGGVSLTTEDNIMSFVRFMSVAPGSRFPHLRALEIASKELSPRTTDALMWLITTPLLALDSLTLREANLVLMSRPSPSEFVRDGVPIPLAVALTELRTLRHLTVGQCDQRACDLVRTICSPLRTVSIDFIPAASGNGDEPENRNPIVLLAKHSETLEEISGSNFAMRPSYPYDVVYPSVRKINATYDPVWCPITLAYICAFPGLTHLSLTCPVRDSGVRFVDPRATVPLSEALERRSGNMRILRAQSPGGLVWKSLEELEGTVADVLALGLVFHVSMVRLTGTALPKSPEYKHITTILEDTRPAGLAITIVGASRFGDTMGKLLRAPSAQQLRTLEVELGFSPSEGDMDVQAVLNNVATTLALLPLQRITLTLNYGLLTAPDESYRTRYGWFCPLERDVEGLDLVATQALFRAAIPSLAADMTVRLSTDRTKHSSRLGVVGSPEYYYLGGSTPIDLRTF